MQIHLSDEEIQQLLLDNALRHRRRWTWNNSINQEHLLTALVEEVEELSAATQNKHEHDVSYELIQIGGIVQNWLRQIEMARVRESAELEKQKHP